MWPRVSWGSHQLFFSYELALFTLYPLILFFSLMKYGALCTLVQLFSSQKQPETVMEKINIHDMVFFLKNFILIAKLYIEWSKWFLKTLEWGIIPVFNSICHNMVEDKVLNLLILQNNTFNLSIFNFHISKFLIMFLFFSGKPPKF